MVKIKRLSLLIYIIASDFNSNNMNKYIEVGYVETSPLECNVCFNDIEKGEIMIGEQKKGTKSNFSWRHLDCMMLTAANK